MALYYGQRDGDKVVVTLNLALPCSFVFIF
jgi:hypothetical protein